MKISSIQVLKRFEVLKLDYLKYQGIKYLKDIKCLKYQDIKYQVLKRYQVLKLEYLKYQILKFKYLKYQYIKYEVLKCIKCLKYQDQVSSI